MDISCRQKPTYVIIVDRKNLGIHFFCQKKKYVKNHQPDSPPSQTSTRLALSASTAVTTSFSARPCRAAAAKVVNSLQVTRPSAGWLSNKVKRPSKRASDKASWDRFRWMGHPNKDWLDTRGLKKHPWVGWGWVFSSSWSVVWGPLFFKTLQKLLFQSMLCFALQQKDRWGGCFLHAAHKGWFFWKGETI